MNSTLLTRLSLGTAVALALLGPASPSCATPALRLSWSDCTPLQVNANAAGPGVYVLNLSVIGLTGPYATLQWGFQFAPHEVAPAWQFYDIDYWTGDPGCQGPARLTLLVGGSSCPVFPITQQQARMQQGSITEPTATGMALQLTFDRTSVADPAQRYTLTQIAFDESQEGPGPGQCAGFEQPFCIAMTVPTLSIPVGPTASTTTAVDAEQGFVTWQDAANGLGCPGAAPARASSWGAVKAQYR
jgi:hypothetical protein